MILEKSQIQRYMRHIVMPEISGKGQKKLLEAKVIVYGQHCSDVSAMASYLTAAGIGQITLALSNLSGFEGLYYRLLDLNPDVSVFFLDLHQLAKTDTSIYSAGIALGTGSFVANTLELMHSQDFASPIVYGVLHHYQGFLHRAKTKAELPHCLRLIKKYKNALSCDKFRVRQPFQELMLGFLGALSAIDAVKALLNLGVPDDLMGCFDLMNLAFDQVKADEEGFYHIFNCFANQASVDREAFQNVLAKSKVLIVGAGGLGCPTALALACEGVGTIGLVDYDVVDSSNLNRQILHSTSRIGVPKVQSAKESLKQAYPNTCIIEHNTAFTSENALELIKDYDIVVDGLDNLPTRYLLNDACCLSNKPFVEAGVLGFIGLVTTIEPGAGHCYRCIFPETERSGPVPSCAEAGVLGPVPGVMGFLQAAEVIKHLTKAGKLLSEAVLLFDAQDMEFSMPEFKRDPYCPVCGDQPSITSLGAYEFKCSSK